MAQHECYSEAAENNKYKCANSDRLDTYFLSMYSGVLILTMDLTPFFPDRKCYVLQPKTILLFRKPFLKLLKTHKTVGFHLHNENHIQ